MSKIILCYRRGWPEPLADKLGAAGIKLAQLDQTYHTALRLSDGWLYQARLSKGVHRTKDDVGDGSWCTLPLGDWADEGQALEYYQAREGHRYDLPGLIDWGLRRYALTLFGVAVRPGLQSPRNEFCSELTMGMLGFADPVRYSPSSAVRECARLNRTERVR